MLPASFALLQEAAGIAHPLAGTVARWMWLLPLLPLLGFVINGALSIMSAYHAGPDDPGAHPHDAHTSAEERHEAHTGHDVTGGGAHGDDHHVVVRHRFAGLSTIIGPGVMVLAFGLAVAIFIAMRAAGDAALHTPFVQRYYEWMPVGDLRIDAAFQLDQLSMVMILVITGVGMLIHLFSVGYMQDDPSYPVLFVGWEGVGLCSYLLIGFWYLDKANSDAGKKAFVMNRIGDVGFLVAMFMLFANLGTLEFEGVRAQAASLGPSVVTWICLFFFLGCAGKSAQIPLYTWLPDAMAGPTPVSALIHAATMVTAGVYLIARSSFLFSLSPVASLTVVVIGALTAIFAASIGLKQWDIKKVLAYSTVSQLGYMFIGVGSGAYVSGVFHLVTHAFFKALLFLGSGSVIFAMHRAYHATHSTDDAQDMRNMGGLARYMPWTFLLMLGATLAIAGIPPFAGFFSKDAILGTVFLRARESTLADAHWLGIPGNILLYACYVIGLAAAFMTAVYMTRMLIYTFLGPNRSGERERDFLGEAPWIMTGPLLVLGVLTVVGGWLDLPESIPIGRVGVLDRWLEPVVGESMLRITHGAAAQASHTTEYSLIGAAVLIAVAGIIVAWAMLKPQRLVPKREAKQEEGFERVLLNKYYVDEIYDDAVVQPTVGVSRSLLWQGIDQGLIDGFMVKFVGTRIPRFVGWVGSQLQSGQVGTYAWVLVVGVLFVLGAFTIR